MKYYYEKPDEWVAAGETYICDHPRYNLCTLFRNGKKGLAVVQERYNEKTKARWWSSIDPWLAGELFLQPDFPDIFEKYAEEASDNGLYPTVTVRKLMWALRVKPLRKEYWEEDIC